MLTILVTFKLSLQEIAVRPVVTENMSGRVKPKKFDWKDSNLALFGSDTEKNVRKFISLNKILDSDDIQAGQTKNCCPKS